jgi:hypothetical protein
MAEFQTLDGVLRTKLDAYQQLLKGEEVTMARDTVHMAFGRRMEGRVAQGWLTWLQQEKDPRARMLQTGLHVHPQHPYIAASPDRLVWAAMDGSQRQRLYLLEVKTRPSRPLPVELPQDDRLQVLMQLACVDTACQALVVYCKHEEGKPLKSVSFQVVWNAAAKEEWRLVVQPRHGQEGAVLPVQLGGCA